MSDGWYFEAVWNNEVYAIATLGGYLYKTGGTAATTGFAAAENTFSPIYTYNIDNYLTVYKGSLYFCGTSPGISDYREPLRLVPTVITHTYSFTGGGNWSNSASWAGSTAPSSTLMQGDTVLINEDCVLDVPVHAQVGSTITIAPGKNLLVQGALTIQ